MNAIDDRSVSEQTVKLFNDIQDINFVEIGIVVLVAWGLTAASKRMLPRVAERAPSRLRLYLLAAVPVIRLLMMLLAVFWIFPIVFNVTFQNFLVIAGGASVAIGFAFKDYVSSLIAGIVAVFERPYRPGDWVKIGGDYGEVQSVGLRALTLRTPSDDIVTIPHLTMWTKNVSNGNDGAKTLMCVADLYVAGTHDAALVRKRLRDVAMSSAYLDYRKPVVVILTQEPWGTHYKLKAYPYDMRDQFMFVSDLVVRGKQVLAELEVTEVSAPYAATRPRDQQTTQDVLE
jgi:small-conductance mechanosensitive channel